VACEEAGEALVAGAGSAVGGWVAAEAGQRDRAVDAGEDGSGARPEAVEQGAELVGECDALRDQVVPATDRGAECLDLAGGGCERAEAMAVGAQDVGQHEGIARVGLAAGGAVAGPAGADHVGMDGDDRVAGLDQGVDDQPRRTLDGNRQFGRGRDPAQAGEQVGQARRAVAHRDAAEDLTCGIDDADGVAVAAPVETAVEWHGLTSLDWGRLTRAGRSCGSLTDTAEHKC
jgi:hypothetical protein